MEAILTISQPSPIPGARRADLTCDPLRDLRRGGFRQRALRGRAGYQEADHEHRVLGSAHIDPLLQFGLGLN